MSKGRVAGKGRTDESGITVRSVTESKGDSARTVSRSAKTGRFVIENKGGSARTLSRSAKTGSFAGKSGASKNAVVARDTVTAGAVPELSEPRRRSTTPARPTSGRTRSTAADDPLAPERTRWLADAVGGLGRLAAMLGVSASQTSRWSRGEERPGIDAAPLLIDLEHVLARVRLVFAEPSAGVWMTSANTYLNRARPIDVLALSGPGPVLEALDAQTWGSAA